MKKIFAVLLVLLTVAAALSANGIQERDAVYGQGSGQGLRDGSGAGRGNGTGRGNGGYGAGQAQNVNGGYYKENFSEDLVALYHGEVGSGVLTESDKEGLLLMVEEEKLARDVYNALYEEWEIPVFRNIAESEQQHMESVAYLLEAYDISAPEETATAGDFANRDLQKIYDDLVKLGSKSIEDALSVGATVEDLDIADLQRLVSDSANDEVKILYQNLMKGSRNHIRSFTAQLDRYGVSYEPQYISDDYYETIMKYNQETAPIADPDYSI